MSSPSTINPVAVGASLRGTVEDAVAAAIVSGELAPGTLVTAPTLAARFGVSATPVREAMLNLQKRGFVDVVRNKGFRITQVSEQDLWEIVRLRQQLEAPPMRGIARTMQPAIAAELRVKAQAIVDAAEVADLAAYLAADLDFHLRLLELHGNRRLIAIVRDLRQQTRMVGLANMIGTAELARSAAEHHLLVDLLEAHDGRGAEALLTDHIGHVLGWWSGNSED
ncbi:GntR family transcriptional regulator [Actinosynnema pretiosum subsp. pretiosum]|uniref:Transcriptional regulator, GntR family n=2 Tax=Actinosynnema TaxID=40566 RepID=C6WN37_ACTMD|nr:GntR family transcriptional regulator [Actinosynnema mirum]ACU38550.1 transcriptional regulator, GntR family [Actinosynnema mirum DSM 43827]QUF03892.1 GntR family transcriptional regulator [Actinosynnema pretiosum subsp. pretiosum]